MTPTNRRWATALVMLGLVLGTGCEGLFGGGASSGLTGLDGGVCDKSYGQRFEERTCDRGCVTGTHCDLGTGTCVWECWEDSDCGTGGVCSCDGYCGAGPVVPEPGATNGSCPRDESLLVEGSDDAPPARERSCIGDESCAYGSHCDPVTRRCAFECLDDPDCSTPGEVCSCRGVCEAPGTLPERPAEVAAQVTVAPAFLSVSSLDSWGRQTLSIELRAAETAGMAGLHPRARVEVLDPDGLGHLSVVPSAGVAERVDRFAGVAFSTSDQTRALDYLASASVPAMTADLGLTAELAVAVTAARPLADLAAFALMGGIDGPVLQGLKTRTQDRGGVSCPSAALVLDDDRWQVDMSNGYVATASVSVGRCAPTPDDAISEVAISTYLVDDAGQLVQHLDYRIVALGTDGAEVAPASPKTGVFVGRLVERAARGGPPLVVPVRAWATVAERMVVIDELRLLSATGWFGLDAGYDMIAAVDPGHPDTEGVIEAVTSDWVERAAPAGRRSGSFVYELRGVPRTFDVELQRTGDPDDPLSGADSELAQAATCTADAGCGPDEACADSYLGRCVPGARFRGELGNALVDLREAAWREGGAFLATYEADWASVSQRIENVMCTPRVDGAAIWTLDSKRDVTCSRSLVPGTSATLGAYDDHAPSVVGLTAGNVRKASVGSGSPGLPPAINTTPVLEHPTVGADWLQTCLGDLRRGIPTVVGYAIEDQVASWHQQGRACIDLGQLFPALGWLVHGSIDGNDDLYVGRRQGALFQRLLAQWLDVHAFVLQQGSAENEVARVLESDRGAPYEGTSDLEPDELMALAERGWEPFLDNSIARPLGRLGRDMIASPDDRVPRPTAYWSFDAGDVAGRHVAAVVGDLDLDFSGTGSVSFVDGALRALGAVNQNFDGLDLGYHRDLTVSFWIDVSNIPAGTSTIFENYYGGVVMLERNPSDRTWRVGAGHGGTYVRSNYQTDSGWVHIAVQRVGKTYSLYKNVVFMAKGDVGSSPVYVGVYRPAVLDASITGATLIVDDIALWDEALSVSQIREIEDLGRSTAARPRMLVDWLASFDTLQDPNREQWVGLPAKIVETATKHVQVVEAYAHDELSAVYETCYRGGASAPQQRATERAARSMRYVYAASSLADELYERATTRSCTDSPECEAIGAAECIDDVCVLADGSPATIELPWSERYGLARAELGSARSRAIEAMAALSRCENPLGIPESDLPLYFGDVAGENGRFFASSDYLMSQWAEPTVRQASAALEAARGSWVNQRDADVRQQLTEQDAERRLESLELRYMEPVVAACGITEYDALDVLEAFDDSARGLTLATCFRKPGCEPGKDTRACLRGSIGDGLLSVRAATMALDLEYKTVDKRLQEWEQQRGFCSFTEQSLFGDLVAMKDYNENARELRKKGRGLMGLIQSGLEKVSDAFQWVDIGGATGGCINGAIAGGTAAGTATGGLGAPAGALIGCGVGALVSVLLGGGAVDHKLATLRDDLELTLAAGRAEREMAGCWDLLTTRQRDLYFQFNYVDQRSLDLGQALFRVDEQLRTVARNITEARAALAREAGRTVPSVAHHYWLGERIERFRIEMERARRFTFLALRSAEYELQQSFGLRSRILTAQHPDDLLDVIYLLDTNRGTRTINNRRPADNTEVISLRTDVLGLEDLRPPAAGERQDSASKRFAAMLMSPENAVYDRDGYYIGQGVPFTLDAVGALKHRCAERVWRVTATIQGDITDADEPGTHAFLLKRNVFQSQWCDGHGDGGEYQQTSTASASNLFLGDAIDPDATNTDFTPALIYPWFNVRRSELFRDQYAEGASEELAGRGLYGEYLLLFPYDGMLEPDPSCEQGEPCADPFRDLSRVEDVLIRFDYASVDNLPL